MSGGGESWHPAAPKSGIAYRQFESTIGENNLSPITSMSVDTLDAERSGSNFVPHPLSGGRRSRDLRGEGYSNHMSSFVSGMDDVGIQIQDPNRLLESTPHAAKDELQRSQINMKSRLPKWMWNLVLLGLGIAPSSNTKRVLVATVLHMVTLFAGLLFAASGMFFNVYDTLSNYTNTTMIMLVTKSAIGLVWICLGIYSNSLAARLFGNPRMADCIRLHSKTFMKVSTVIIVSGLFMAVLVANLYNNKYLLDSDFVANSTEERQNPNCATIGISEVLCHIYYYSKILYSIFCMTWNLLVCAIFMSVCRTHTIGIRRFMKELIYDSKIYEEFCVLKTMNNSTETYEESLAPHNQDFVDSLDVWDDDITGWDDCDDPLPNSARVLKTLRIMRINSRNYDRSMSFRERYMASYNIAMGRESGNELRKPTEITATLTHA